LPHSPNFTPIAAAALFAGVVLPKRLAITVPLLAMFVSDLAIGFYDWRIMAAVYFSFALTAVFGILARREKNRAPAILGGALAGSVVFFVITNFAVWLWSGIYEKNFNGLIAAYALAIPFFRNTLFGDLFYSAVFFGLWSAAVFAVRNWGWFRDRQMLRDPRF